MFSKLLFFQALVALAVADVSHLTRAYLPPHPAPPQHIESPKPEQPQVQHDEVSPVQLDVVLLDESVNGNSHALKDVEQTLENEPVAATQQSATIDNASSESSSDPFFQPGFGGFPGAGFQPGFGRPTYPGQGFPGQGFPGQGFPGQGFPGQGFPGVGFPGQGFPGQGFPGQGLPGQGFPGAGFPGQGFPGQGFPGQGFPGQVFPGQGFPGAGFPGQGFPGQGFPGQGFPGQGFPGAGFPGQGFPGLPYQTPSQQQSSGGFNTPQPVAGLNNRAQTRRIASDTVYGANGGYVYDKPK